MQNFKHFAPVATTVLLAALLSVSTLAFAQQTSELAPDSGVDSGHQVQPDASQPMSTNGMEDMQDADMMNDTNSGAETLAPANGVDAQEERANGMAQSGNSTDWTSYSSEPLVDDSGVDAEDDHIDSNSP